MLLLRGTRLNSTLSLSSRMFANSAYKPSQPKTFQFQKDLPKLPVPSLEASFERYIKSLKPHLLQKALKNKNGAQFVESELAARREMVKDFMKVGGLGRTLQERLIGE